MKHRLNYMLSLLILPVLIVGSNIAPVHAAPSLTGFTTPAEMEAFLDGVFTAQMDAGHVPGAVVAVVKDGEVFFSKGYGYANVEEQTEVSPQRTLFRIGSTSKLFVWTSVMQLVEQGRLDLDADVNTYLDFQIPAAYSEPITMKHLMDHTPGFEEAYTGLAVYEPEQLTSLGEFLAKHIPARVFPAGEVTAYSNYGAALAAYVVERISGMPFDEYVEKNIFQPLGMKHTTFQQPLPESFTTNMAQGYVYFQGAYQQGSFELIQAYPAGSVSSTAEDMAKFMIAHLQNGLYGDTRILEDASASQMHGDLSNGMAYGFFRAPFNGQMVIDHGGDTNFFQTGFYLLPDHNAGIFFSTNISAGVRDVIFESFMNHYFPAPVQPQPTPPADMAARAEQYEGEYYSARNNFTTVEKITSIGNAYKIDVDQDGYVLVSAADSTARYVEIEPGVLQRLDNPSVKLTLRVKDGQTYLAYNPVHSYVKAAWYQTDSFNLFLLGFPIIFMLFTLIAWTISFVKGLIAREPRPWLQRSARIVGVIFIGLLFAFLVGFMAEIANADPITGTPMFIFEMPNHLAQVLMIPPVLVLAGLLLIPFMMIVWFKRFWSFSGRLHYTLLTLSACAMLWELSYLNLLKF